ncbi:MAG: AI-2E family transporter [Ruminococcus sp.]|nr:AI-2E family transporter [Ruminococcus sp.]
MKKSYMNYGITALLVVTVCVTVRNSDVIFDIIRRIVQAMMPLVTGCITAYVFNIIMNFYERHYFPESDNILIVKTRRPVCIILSFASAVVMIVIIVSIVYPELSRAFRIIYAEIPEIFTDLQRYAGKHIRKMPALQKFIGSLPDSVGAYDIVDSLVTLIGSAVSFVTDILIAVIFALYVLLCKERLLNNFRRLENALLGEQVRKYVNHVIRTADNIFRNYIVGQFTECIIIGMLCFIGMTLLHLPYALMSGTVVGVTALVPIVGAVAGMLISGFIIFTASPVEALVFVIFLLILQQLEDNVIYPAIVGTSTGLPAIWVLASVTVGGALFGITGMILGVPVTATLYRLGLELLGRYEKNIKDEV